MRQTMRCPSALQAYALDEQTESRARTTRIFRMGRTLLYVASLPHLGLRKLLLHGVEPLLGVADDDDRRRAAEVLLGELLVLRGCHRLDGRDVAVDLAEVDAVDRQLADAARDPCVR